MNSKISPEKERMAEQREARLASALRANLRRRKEKARGDVAANGPAQPEEPAVILTAPSRVGKAS